MKKGKCDYWTFLIVLVLVGIGLVMVLSASQYFAQHKPYEDSFYFLKRQAVNVAVGFVAMYFASRINYRVYRKFYIIALLAGMALMVLVLVSSLGDSAKGAQRWIDLGFVRFQPSDIMKICLILFLAKTLSERQERMHSFVKDFLPYLVIVGVVCALVAINDLGTAIVMAGTVFFMFIAASVPSKYLASLVGAGAGLIAVAIAVEPYRMKRLTGFANPWADPLDTGYQTIQSLLAIGSGGFMGVGLGQGGSKWFYLPEQYTDFIFSVLVEEGGFIAGTLLILLFLLFTWRGITIALKVEDSFGSLLAMGITLMISVQALVNIGIALGLMPVTGITLPFISYGGTSVVVSLAAVGVLLNISRFAKMDK